MIHFKSHEIREKENNYVEIILHLDPGSNFSVEFSKEFGQSNDEKDLQQAAQNYVQENLPSTKFNKIKVMVGGVVIATILGATLIAPGGNQASASPLGSDVAITGGQLAVESLSVGTFDAVVLNGKIQSTSATITPFNVTDPSGTGAGWNVVMSATQFSDTTGKTLPKGSLTVAAPTIAIADGAEGSSPADTITKTGGTIDDEIGVKILSAPADNGMGTYTVSFADEALNLTLLPKDVKAGTYTSTIKVDINNGP
ncbi:WxL domain-containing protein [Paucisalibacillus globulus]|uniref:WxL domain-containing protein n=1 Tax=Paucisalibacillus globulus TaxID=351095 RepID=UPI00041C999B|nr:WxL domain-containing protein [Paucisalibacillus globulus]